MMKNKNCERDNYQMYTESSVSYNNGNMASCMPPCPPSEQFCCAPICECPQNRVCHRTLNYNVPHIIPVNTTTVNHHIYNHTYTPVYSYSEVDEVSNVYQDRCCK